MSSSPPFAAPCLDAIPLTLIVLLRWGAVTLTVLACANEYTSLTRFTALKPALTQPLGQIVQRRRRGHHKPQQGRADVVLTAIRNVEGWATAMHGRELCSGAEDHQQGDGGHLHRRWSAGHRKSSYFVW